MSGRLGAAIRRRTESRRRQRGAAAVEFALVLTPLIMILVGTVTTGVSYSNALGVTNAVREGARFGAVADASSGSWASDVIGRVRQTQFDDPSNKTSICVELVKGGGAVKSLCEAAGGPGVSAADMGQYPLPTVPTGVCVVRVVAAREYQISAPPLVPPVTRTMVRGSVARYERTTC